MAINQPAIYGGYNYARPVGGTAWTLYANNLLPQTITASLFDMMTPSDSSAAQIDVPLMDFLLVKEWVSIQLSKAIIWVNPEQNANTVDSLYARSSVGPVVYGGKNILYGGLKPQAFWTPGIKRMENWTQTDGHKYNS